MSDAAFEDLYREVILDHYKNPRGHGVLEDADARAEGQNPLCGDEVAVSVRFAPDGETIEAVGLGAAVDYLEGIGFDAISEHEHELTAYALERLAELPWVKIFGPPLERRAGIISFEVEGVHPHDVAQILDRHGVAIRAGHHCTQPLMRRLGVAATNRASFYLYTIPEEIDQLVEGVHAVRKVFA